MEGEKNTKAGDEMDTLFPDEVNIIRDFTAIDLETSGLYPNNKIIEFGAVRYRDGQVVKTFQTYVHNPSPLPQKIVEITGITDEMLSKLGMDKNEAMKNFLDFIGDDLLVAHNMDFDLSFLNYHTKALNLSIPNKTSCTLLLARKKSLPIKNNKLETLCNHYRITCDKYHSALDDAKAAGDLFLQLQKDNN